MQPRAALRETLEGWQKDIQPPCRDVVGDVSSAFENVDPKLEFEPREPIFPAWRGRVIPGAPASAEPCVILRPHSAGVDEVRTRESPFSLCNRRRQTTDEAAVDC